MMIARGRYSYRLNDALQAVVEPWELSRSDTGLRLQGQRLVDDHPILRVSADYHATHCHTLQVIWQSTDTDPPRHFDYHREPDRLRWQERGHGEQELKLPADCRLFPLLRAATGVVLPALESSGDLVLPNLRQPDANDFLSPLLSRRHSQRIAQEGELQHYRYFGGEYGEQGSDYWLNRHGLVERYLWQSSHGRWDVQLQLDEIDQRFCWLNERSTPATAE